MTGYDTSPAGIAAAGGKANADLRDAKAGSAKSTSGTYSDVTEAPSRGAASVASNFINKPAMANPSAAMAGDTSADGGSVVGAKDDMRLGAAKAGSPKGTSGTHRDV